MSPGQTDRKFQSFSRNRFLVRKDRRLDADNFARAISRALRTEYGDTHAAVKTIVRRTGANARSARNWLEGRNAPNGRFLVELCRQSDRVFETVVRLSEREQVLKAKKLIDARERLREMVNLLDELEKDPTSNCSTGWPETLWVAIR
jgi:hypothetical protein